MGHACRDDRVLLAFARGLAVGVGARRFHQEVHLQLGRRGLLGHLGRQAAVRARAPDPDPELHGEAGRGGARRQGAEGGQDRPHQRGPRLLLRHEGAQLARDVERPEDRRVAQHRELRADQVTPRERPSPRRSEGAPACRVGGGAGVALAPSHLVRSARSRPAVRAPPLAHFSQKCLSPAQ